MKIAFCPHFLIRFLPISNGKYLIFASLMCHVFHYHPFRSPIAVVNISVMYVNSLAYLWCSRTNSPARGQLRSPPYCVLHCPHLLGQSEQWRNKKNKILIHSRWTERNAISTIQFQGKRKITSLPSAVYVLPSMSRLSSSSSSSEPSDSDFTVQFNVN